MKILFSFNSNNIVESLTQIMQNIVNCNFLKIDYKGDEYETFRNAKSSSIGKFDYIAMEEHIFDHKMEEKFSNLINKKINLKFKLSLIRFTSQFALFYSGKISKNLVQKLNNTKAKNFKISY